jgi:hypothetical protein
MWIPWSLADQSPIPMAGQIDQQGDAIDLNVNFQPPVLTDLKTSDLKTKTRIETNNSR